MFTRRTEAMTALLELSEYSYGTLEQAEAYLRSGVPGVVPVLYGATAEGDQKLIRLHAGSGIYPELHTVLGVRVVPDRLWDLYELAVSVLPDIESTVNEVAKQERSVRFLLSKSVAYVDGPVRVGLRRWDLCVVRGIQVARTMMPGESGLGSERVFGTLIATEAYVEEVHNEQKARFSFLTGK